MDQKIHVDTQIVMIEIVILEQTVSLRVAREFITIWLPFCTCLNSDYICVE
jgi:hypothetical protein